MEKVVVVEVGVEEVVQRMKNCRSASTHRSYTESSSSTPWIVSAVTTVAYLCCGAHTTPCTSIRPPQVASTLTHSVHRPDHGWTLDCPSRASSRHRA